MRPAATLPAAAVFFWVPPAFAAAVFVAVFVVVLVAARALTPLVAAFAGDAGAAPAASAFSNACSGVSTSDTTPGRDSLAQSY